MGKIVVPVPNVDRDERIGSVFNHLFNIIYQTEGNDSNVIIWDFSNTTFFHPFFLAPLVIYKQRCEKKIECINIPYYLSKYLELVNFHTPFLIEEGMDLGELLEEYVYRSYIPVCQFDLCNNNVDALQTVLQNIIERQCDADKNITTPLSYFLGELVCNISQHSYSKYGYIFSQYLTKEKCIDLIIADNGITVFGSYVRTGKYLDDIGGNEAKALKMANEGYSTKDLPENENRGFGISTSKSMLVDGLNGAFFMLSGGAFHRHDNNVNVFVKLPEPINWSGTIILMRIPVTVPTDFKYLKYVR